MNSLQTRGDPGHPFSGVRPHLCAARGRRGWARAEVRVVGGRHCRGGARVRVSPTTEPFIEAFGFTGCQTS